MGHQPRDKCPCDGQIVPPNAGTAVRLVDCRVGEHSFGSGMEVLIAGMRKFGVSMSDLTGWTCPYCKATCSGESCKNCGAPRGGEGK